MIRFSGPLSNLHVFLSYFVELDLNSFNCLYFVIYMQIILRLPSSNTLNMVFLIRCSTFHMPFGICEKMSYELSAFEMHSKCRFNKFTHTHTNPQSNVIWRMCKHAVNRVKGAFKHIKMLSRGKLAPSTKTVTEMWAISMIRKLLLYPFPPAICTTRIYMKGNTELAEVINTTIKTIAKFTTKKWMKHTQKKRSQINIYWRLSLSIHFVQLIA